MTPCLLPGANLHHLRKQARRLQRGVRAGEPDALAMLARHHPQPQAAAPGQPLTLTGAQLVVARAYGFDSWPQLVAHLAAAAPLRSDPTVHGPPGEPAADRFCRLACLTWTADDHPDHRAAADGLLQTGPGLVRESVFAAAAAADPVAVAHHLRADPARATAAGGPHGWVPLLYLCASRAGAAASDERVLATARLLLDAGADPDAGFLWQGLVPPFTALTAAFGEGEQGPVRQPRHPHATALARLLLRAGADPNDGQTLYNRVFRPDDDHLVLLLEHGLGTGDGGPWRRRLGSAMPSPAQLLREQVERAVEYGYPGRVRLLAAAGADVRTPLTDGTTLAEGAARRGDDAVLSALLEGGAPAPGLDDVDRLIGAALAGDVTRVGALTRADPQLAARARARRPDAAAAVRRPDAVPLLVRLGFDLDRAPGNRTALHEAAMADDLPLVRALVEAGADPGVVDDEHGSTPLGWAEHTGAAAAGHFLTALVKPRRSPGDDQG